MYEAVVSLGSNLFDKEKNLKKSMSLLNLLPDTCVHSVSKIYLSKPFRVPDEQDDYLNCCVKLLTSLEPYVLLGCCLGIETSMGRRRSYKNAARIIDIDLLFYENVQINTQNLILPHPRIRERAFVMLPLSDLFKNQIAFNFNFQKNLKSIDISEVKLYKNLLT